MHYVFDECLSGNVPPGYSDPSMRTDEVSRSWIFGHFQSACFRKLKADYKYEHITQVLPTLRIVDLQHTKVFLLKPSVLFYEI